MTPHRITELRASARLLEAAAELNRAFATDLHGQRKTSEAFDMERRAEVQEDEACRLRELAAGLAGSLVEGRELMAVAV